MKNLIVAIALSILWIKSYGQSFVQSENCTVSVSPIFSFSVSNPTSSISLTSISEVKNGKPIPNFSTISVKSNKNWQLSVKAQSSSFTLLSGGGGGGQPLAASKLKIKPSSGGGYKTISTTPQVLKSGSRGNTTKAGNTFNTDIMFSPGLTSKGGIYSIVLVYTLSQP